MVLFLCACLNDFSSIPGGVCWGLRLTLLCALLCVVLCGLQAMRLILHCRRPRHLATLPMHIFLLPPACMFSYHPPYAAPFSDYGLVAAMCSALGNLNFEGVS